jgi:hypothetical protein
MSMTAAIDTHAGGLRRPGDSVTATTVGLREAGYLRLVYPVAHARGLVLDRRHHGLRTGARHWTGSTRYPTGRTVTSDERRVEPTHRRVATGVIREPILLRGHGPPLRTRSGGKPGVHRRGSRLRDRVHTGSPEVRCIRRPARHTRRVRGGRKDLHLLRGGVLGHERGESVEHRFRHSAFPNWEGLSPTRYFSVSRDGERLELTTDPQVSAVTRSLALWRGTASATSETSVHAASRSQPGQGVSAPKCRMVTIRLPPPLFGSMRRARLTM